MLGFYGKTTLRRILNSQDHTVMSEYCLCRLILGRTQKKPSLCLTLLIFTVCSFRPFLIFSYSYCCSGFMKGFVRMSLLDLLTILLLSVRGYLYQYFKCFMEQVILHFLQVLGTQYLDWVLILSVVYKYDWLKMGTLYSYHPADSIWDPHWLLKQLLALQ